MATGTVTGTYIPPGLAANQTYRRDPTRTAGLRAQYAADVRRRFGVLNGLIKTTVVENDALVLSDKRQISTLQARPARRYDFPSDVAGKQQAFMDWLMEASDQEILEVIRRDGRRIVLSGEWQNVYVRTGYGRGVDQASTGLRRVGFDVPEYSLAGVFNSPMHADILAALYVRNFNELKGITDVMGQQIARTLAEGLARGLGPREIARMIVGRVNGVGLYRATMLARTEIIRAHAEATLNRFEEFGVQQVGVFAEFSTSGDKQVCSKCEALEREDHGYGPGVFPIQAAHGLIPLHPQCRCAWLPVIVKPVTNRRYFVGSSAKVLCYNHCSNPVQ